MSGFNSADLIKDAVGGYAYEIDFGAHYSVYSIQATNRSLWGVMFVCHLLDNLE